MFILLMLSAGKVFLPLTAQEFVPSGDPELDRIRTEISEIPAYREN